MHETTTSATLLLALYRSARELPTNAFQDRALRLLKSLLKFESAIWGSGTTDGQGISARTAHLHDVDPAALSDWKQINGKDKLTALGLASMGRTVHAYIPALYAESEDAEYRAYAAKWKRKDTLGTGLPEPSPGAIQWVSLYRHTDRLFTEGERMMCELVMPHFAEALRINQVIDASRGAASPQARSDARRLALSEADGRIRFAQGGFLDLLALEWAQAEDGWLPAPLLAAAADKRAASFVGRSIKVSIRYSTELLLLEAERRTLIDSLPPRRARIAAMFAEGHSHKEIARQLHIAPPTVRNQIAAAYRSLGISSRTQLISMARELDVRG